jgi:flagellar biosynthesis/type III secretory pathway protein FliH
MNSWFESSVVEADQATRVIPARLDYDLRASSLAESTFADPRIVDPRLEELVRTALTEGRATARAEGFAQGYADGSAQARAEVTEHVTTTLTASLTAEHTAAYHARVAAHDEEHRLRMEALEVAIAAVRTAASALENVTVPLYSELGQDLGNVVYSLVEELLGHELSVDRPHVLESISRVAAEIPVGAAIILRLNPDDATALHDGGINLSEVLARPVQVVPDTTVTRNSAFVDSDFLHVDFQITEALDRLREAITS